MIKKISITILLALCLVGVTGPVVVSAASPLPIVKCGTGGSSTATDRGASSAENLKTVEECNFAAFVDMINRIITYMIIIAMPLAAISFCVAGAMYLFAGDNSGQVSKAKGIFISVGIGFALVLSAWLIFKFIENTFLNTGAGYGSYLTK